MAVDVPSAPKGGALSCEAMKGEGSRSLRYILLFDISPTAIRAGASSGKYRAEARSFELPERALRSSLKQASGRKNGRSIPDFECGLNDEHFRSSQRHASLALENQHFVSDPESGRWRRDTREPVALAT